MKMFKKNEKCISLALMRSTLIGVVLSVLSLQAYSYESEQELKILNEYKIGNQSDKNVGNILNDEVLKIRKKKRVKKEIFNYSESKIYSHGLQSYRLKDLVGIEASIEVLKFRFSKSPFLDNLTYYKGMYFFEKEQYAESLNVFNEVIEKYPHSNKFVSSLYGKAVAYKKLNLLDFSEKIFKKIMNDFPGSKESQQAIFELKIIDKKRI